MCSLGGETLGAAYSFSNFPETAGYVSPSNGRSHSQGPRLNADSQQWLQRCTEGDPVACRELVEQYGRVAGTIILRTLGRRDQVEDLLQETFLRVFRALPEFQGRAKLSTWICTIAQRVAVDELRRQQRSVAFFHDEEAPEAVDAANVERDADRESTDASVRKALASLPDKYRLPLSYAAIDELDYDTIASMLGIPVGTVKTNVHRGKHMLRERLEGLI
jgi:RNA polymerase sigma-70 factor, ECF subfamily